MSLTRAIHDILLADPAIALFPILTAMGLVVLGNWLVGRHYRANGHQPPTILGRSFHGWLPARETCRTTSAYRNAAVVTLVLLYVLVGVLVIMGVSFKMHTS